MENCINLIHDLLHKAKSSLEQKSYSTSTSYLKQCEFLLQTTKLPPSSKSDLLFELANQYQCLNQKKSSITILTSILKTSPDPKSQAKAHLNLAGLFTLQGLYEKSIFHNSKALFLLYETQEHEGQVSGYLCLAICYQRLRQSAKSIAACKQGLQISQKHLGQTHKLTQILQKLYYESYKDLKLLGNKNSLLTRCEEL